MISDITSKRKNLSYRILSCFIAVTFICNVVLPPGYAQVGTGLKPVPAILNLPAPGTMVPLSAGFTPALVKGITIHPEDPLRFDFFISRGDTRLEGKALKEESRTLIKYFLASLTVPEEELWVNLSPYEKDRIIPQGFGETEMGRDMLAQDYILKQLTASLMYPEKELGQKFWDQVYKKAQEKYGTTEIPVDTFNKVWIVPEKAIVYEHDNSVFVVESKLKVMLESDYQAQKLDARSSMSDSRSNIENPASSIETEIIKEIIIPAIEKEVNEGQSFATLRQIYNSSILAVWYKENLKNSLLGQVYADQNKIKGIDLSDKNVKEKIYNQYLEAFKKGVYNYIKEDYDPATQNVIPRKYFSGGTNLTSSPIRIDLSKEHWASYSEDRKQLIQKAVSDGEIEVSWLAVENATDRSIAQATGKKSKVSAEPVKAGSSPVMIGIKEYETTDRLEEKITELLNSLVRQYGNDLYSHLDEINKHPLVTGLMSLKDSPEGNELVMREEATQAEKEAYLASRARGEWVKLLPAGGDATRLGLGVPKILLNLTELLSKQQEESLNAAIAKALAKGEITQGQIEEIKKLKAEKHSDLRNISILGRILENKANMFNEMARKKQTFIIVPSEGDENAVAQEVKKHDYYGFGREAFIIAPQVKNSMYTIDGNEIKKVVLKKAGGNGVPIVETALEGKSYIIGEDGALQKLAGTALGYAKSRGAKYVSQGTIGDLRSWGEEVLNEEFVGRVFEELSRGEIVAAAEYVKQNPKLPQKGGSVFYHPESGNLVFVEKLAMGRLLKKVDFIEQPLATFNHVFTIEALESIKDSNISMYVRSEKDKDGRDVLFTELVGGDTLMVLQEKGYKVGHVERPITIHELKGTASLIPTIKAALQQDTRKNGTSSPVVAYKDLNSKGQSVIKIINSIAQSEQPSIDNVKILNELGRKIDLLQPRQKASAIFSGFDEIEKSVAIAVQTQTGRKMAFPDALEYLAYAALDPKDTKFVDEVIQAQRKSLTEALKDLADNRRYQEPINSAKKQSASPVTRKELLESIKAVEKLFIYESKTEGAEEWFRESFKQILDDARTIGHGGLPFILSWTVARMRENAGPVFAALLRDGRVGGLSVDDKKLINKALEAFILKSEEYLGIRGEETTVSSPVVLIDGKSAEQTLGAAGLRSDFVYMASQMIDVSPRIRGILENNQIPNRAEAIVSHLVQHLAGNADIREVSVAGESQPRLFKDGHYKVAVMQDDFAVEKKSKIGVGTFLGIYRGEELIGALFFLNGPITTLAVTDGRKFAHYAFDGTQFRTRPKTRPGTLDFSLATENESPVSVGGVYSEWSNLFQKYYQENGHEIPGSQDAALKTRYSGVLGEDGLVHGATATNLYEILINNGLFSEIVSLEEARILSLFSQALGGKAFVMTIDGPKAPGDIRDIQEVRGVAGDNSAVQVYLGNRGAIGKLRDFFETNKASYVPKYFFSRIAPTLKQGSDAITHSSQKLEDFLNERVPADMENRADVIDAIKIAAEVARKVGPLYVEGARPTGEIDSGGAKELTIDKKTDQLLIDAFTGKVGAYYSEDRGLVSDFQGKPGSQLQITADALDGSSRVEANGGAGSILSSRRKLFAISIEKQSGREIIASILVAHGITPKIIIAIEGMGAHEFVIDEGTFYHSRAIDLGRPKDETKWLRIALGGTRAEWPKGFPELVDKWVEEDAMPGYSGAFVTDIFGVIDHILAGGHGIFAQSRNKLRTKSEIQPVAHLIRVAGGAELAWKHVNKQKAEGLKSSLVVALTPEPEPGKQQKGPSAFGDKETIAEVEATLAAASPVSFSKATIDDVKEFMGKVFMVRVDFNVPRENGNITDDSRIRAALPLIETITSRGGKVLLTAHLERPQERIVEIMAVKREQGTPSSTAHDQAVAQMQKELTLAPVAKRLKQLLAEHNIKTYFNPDYRTAGQEEAAAFIGNVMKNGEVLLFENVRFNKEEEILVNAQSKLKKAKTETEKLRDENEVTRAREAHQRFSEELFKGVDVFVEEAFGAIHRGHASLVGAPQNIPRVAGPLVKAEVIALKGVLPNLNLAIMGGSKVSDKIKILKRILALDTVKTVLIGGAMANSFLAARGYQMGDSFGTKADQVDLARELLVNPKIVIPIDGVIASRFDDKAEHRVITFGEEDVPLGWMVVDIGPKTRALYARKIGVVPAGASIFWNGPMGAYDKLPSFAAEGTREVAQATAEAEAWTVVGGGDSAAAINTFGISGYDHISTGGGASLELLELPEGQDLPGIAVLSPALAASPVAAWDEEEWDRQIQQLYNTTDESGRDNALKDILAALRVSDEGVINLAIDSAAKALVALETEENEVDGLPVAEQTAGRVKIQSSRGVVEQIRAAAWQRHDALAAEKVVSSPVTEQQGQGSRAKGQDKVGGIDFNPALLDLQIKRDANFVPLPLPQQPIGEMHIDGFIPVIINIQPVTNLPLLLGLADTQEDTQEITPSLKAREVEPVSLLN